MTDHLTEDDILAVIPGLTRPRLVTFIEAEMVIPLRRQDAVGVTLLFRQVDCARVRLLCELADDLDLNHEALAAVISLIDQLHATRQDLLAITRAVSAEPTDIRTRIASAVIKSQT